MKYTKRILSFLLAVSVCLSLSVALVSCGQTGNGENPPVTGGNPDTPPADTKVSYSVTIQDKDGNAVPGVKLIVSDGASLFLNAETDTNGKATVKTDTEITNPGVMLTSVPEGYEKPAAVSGVFHAMFGTAKELTMKIEKTATETVTYTVKVVDQDGNAVAGVELQICHTSCVSCDPTDANGETTKTLRASDVEGKQLKVGILNAPDGYTIPEATIDDDYHAVIEVGDTSVTVVITKN